MNLLARTVPLLPWLYLGWAGLGAAALLGRGGGADAAVWTWLPFMPWIVFLLEPVSYALWPEWGKAAFVFGIPVALNLYVLLFFAAFAAHRRAEKGSV